LDKFGVIALDFETVIDNDDITITGNVKPFMLCLYGHGWVDSMNSCLIEQ